MAEEPNQEYIQVTYTKSRPYRWAAGKYLSRLYNEMKERKKLITNQCPKCREFIWPPAEVCGRCNVKAGDDWVALSDKGTVVQFTYVNYPQWDPHKGDYATEEYPYATILLDDGLYWVSRLEEKDKDKLKKGMRVQAVWREEDRGRGLDEDILYFRTIDE
jgi:uncharacterized OB-fold protein